MRRGAAGRGPARSGKRTAGNRGTSDNGRRRAMRDASGLSRRERQIMEIVFALGQATVNQVVEAIPDAPTPMAVRRLMHILEAKMQLRRKKRGREVVYSPRETRAKAGRSALARVLETFFG